jgi:hypothetical protein
VIRRAITGLVFVTAGFSCAEAQKFEAGVKAGLNISIQNFTGPAAPSETNAGAGFLAGAYAYSMFGDRMGFQGEIIYSIQQIDLNYNGTKYRDSFTFINVPLFLRYKFKDKLSAHAGCQLGFLTDASETSSGFKYDTRSSFTNADFGLVIGGAIELPLKLNATLRYTFGINDVDKLSDSTTRNGNFQVAIGYKIIDK